MDALGLQFCTVLCHEAVQHGFAGAIGHTGGNAGSENEVRIGHSGGDVDDLFFCSALDQWKKRIGNVNGA